MRPACGRGMAPERRSFWSHDRPAPDPRQSGSRSYCARSARVWAPRPLVARATSVVQLSGIEGESIMRRTFALVGILCLSAAGCGGGTKKPTKPKPVAKPTKPKPKPETEEDRVAKRLTAAHEIVPEGSNCLPTTLH